MTNEPGPLSPEAVRRRRRFLFWAFLLVAFALLAFLLWLFAHTHAEPAAVDAVGTVDQLMSALR